MKRKEYLLGELPEELCIAPVQAMARSLSGDSGKTLTISLTVSGVRYRVYRDAQAKESHKSFCDLADALLGADVSAEDIRIAMGTLGLDVEAQSELWARIAEARREEFADDEQAVQS
jgi:hypothetical protein